MENPQNDSGAAANQIYQYAANLLVNENKSESEVEDLLVEMGLDANSAQVVVENLSAQIEEAKIEKANKDMLYGALWCVGGIIATVANFGYVFWGAIIFGGIQFFRGVAAKS